MHFQHFYDTSNEINIVFLRLGNRLVPGFLVSLMKNYTCTKVSQLHVMDISYIIMVGLGTFRSIHCKMLQLAFYTCKKKIRLSRPLEIDNDDSCKIHDWDVLLFTVFRWSQRLLMYQDSGCIDKALCAQSHSIHCAFFTAFPLIMAIVSNCCTASVPHVMLFINFYSATWPRILDL